MTKKGGGKSKVERDNKEPTKNAKTSRAAKDKDKDNKHATPGKNADGSPTAAGLATMVKNLRKKQLTREDTCGVEVGGGASVNVAEGGGGDGSKNDKKSVKGGKKEKELLSKTTNKKKKSQHHKKNRTQRTEERTEETVVETGSHREKDNNNNNNNGNNPGRVRNVPTSKAQIDNYNQFMIEACNVSVNGIIKQFNDFLKAFVPPGATTKAFEKHVDKNRYKDVICLDQTRIILKGKPGENDYVHANIVDGEPLCNKFIACQGPLHNTTYDFWRMVVQEKSQNIFMLCQTIEMDKEKCHQYWPKDKGCAMTFKDIGIRNIEVDKVSDNTSVISTLQISLGGKESFSLKHYHWQSWPDRSVPQSILAPFRLLKIARTSKTPTIIHCSAGVGRTGAVIGIELALQHILTGKPMNMTQVVQELRMKRMHCVQTDMQLVYMYRCLIAYAEVSGLLKNNAELDARTKLFIRDYDALIAERLTGPSNSPPKLPTYAVHPSKEHLIQHAPNQSSPSNPSPAQSPHGTPFKPQIEHLPPGSAPAKVSAELPPKSDYF